MSTAFKTTLPDDILHLVFKQLQPEPTPRQLGYLPVFVESERNKQKALYNLLLSSKTFHAIAAPILYTMVLPCAASAPTLDSIILVEGLVSSFAASSTKLNYKHIRKLHLVFSLSDHKGDYAVVLDILETCAGTVEELAIQGDTYHHQLTPHTNRLSTILARCDSLQHLSVCFPNSGSAHTYTMLREVFIRNRVLSSIQLLPPPRAPTAQEANSQKPILEAKDVHFQTKQYSSFSDPLYSLNAICKPNLVQSFSLRGSTGRLWETRSQQYGPWNSLREIHLDSEISWEPLRFEHPLGRQASAILPALQMLRTNLPWAAVDAHLMAEMRCYPSNLIKLHIEKFWWKVPSLLADLLSEERLSCPPSATWS